MWKVHCPGSIADCLDGHFREWTELIGERLDDGGTGGRGEFGFDGDVDEWDSLEQFGGAWCGDRADAVVDMDLSVSGGDRAADDGVGSEQIESDGGSDDVDYRVDGADFVEVYGVDGGTVHVGFGQSDGEEDFASESFLGFGDPVGPIEQSLDIGHVSMSVLFGVNDLDVSRSETAFLHGLAFEPHVIELDRVDPGPNQFDVDAGIDQSGERHVAADSGRAVEVGDAHVEG